MKTSQVVLVTGSSSGFGRLIALALARRGYRVFGSMRESTGRNAAASGEFRAVAEREGLALEPLELDVTSDASVEDAVRAVLERAGRIDILVNNAGIACLGVAEAFTLAQARRIFEVNFFGVARMNRAVLPQMRRQRSGLLVHISSGSGRGVLPAMGFYTASKFALEALAETFRYELAALGIDSIIVEPGPYSTPILERFEEPADQARAAAYSAIAEVPKKVHGLLTSAPGDPQEVAEAVVRLIETPAGERPLRTVLGELAQALVPLNEFAAQLQRGIFEATGLLALLSMPR